MVKLWIMENKVKQRSEDWFKLRSQVSLTASRFGDALGVGRGKPFDFFMHLISGNCEEDEDEEPNAAMIHGTKMEAVIHEAYELLTGSKTRESGFWEPLKKDMLNGLVGASPDAIVCNRQNPSQSIGICEFKAPVYRMYGGDHCRHQIPRNYMTQIQGQMAITGVPWCDFMAVCSKTREIILKRVHFNSTYWIHASAALHEFCLAVKEAKHRKQMNNLPITNFAGAKKLEKLPFHHSLLQGEGLIKVEDLLSTNDKGEFYGPSRLWLSYDFLVGSAYTLPSTLKSYSDNLIQSIDRKIQGKVQKPKYFQPRNFQPRPFNSRQHYGRRPAPYSYGPFNPRNRYMYPYR